MYSTDLAFLPQNSGMCICSTIMEKQTNRHIQAARTPFKARFAIKNVELTEIVKAESSHSTLICLPQLQDFKSCSSHKVSCQMPHSAVYMTGFQSSKFDTKVPNNEPHITRNFNLNLTSSNHLFSWTSRQNIYCGVHENYVNYLVYAMALNTVHHCQSHFPNLRSLEFL